MRFLQKVGAVQTTAESMSTKNAFHKVVQSLQQYAEYLAEDESKSAPKNLADRIGHEIKNLVKSQLVEKWIHAIEGDQK